MRSRRLALPLVALLTLAAAPPPPKRIVSLNLCADQYLVALADRSQIAALTQFARDPQMSAVAAQARTMPISHGRAEDVLALAPDLIVASPGLRVATMAALEGRSIATLKLPSAESYAEILAQIRQVAAAVGHADRGEALIRRMEAALARLPRGAGRGRVAAYYQRRGYLTGSGTLVDDVMRRVGLVNLAGKLGRPSFSQLSLEQLVAAPPDFLLVETATQQITDQGTEMLHHPALDRIGRLLLPQAWTVCGGPAYVLAVASLSRQLARR